MPTQPTASDHNDRLDMRQLLATLQAVKKGDFTVRMPSDQSGLPGKISDTLNDIIELNESMTREFGRINRNDVRKS